MRVAMRKALDELAALFHDGKVGAEIGIEHIVKAQFPQRRGQNTRRSLLRCETEILRPRRADSRRDLHDGRELRVCQHPVHMVGIVPLFQRANGTVGHALAAIGAKRTRKAVCSCRADRCPRAGPDQIPDMYALHFIADLHAAHAFDAAVFKAQNGRGIVDRCRAQLFLIGRSEKIIVVRELLELAVAAARTFDTVHLMLAEQQLEIDAPRHTHLLGVRVDDHALMDLVVTRGN